MHRHFAVMAASGQSAVSLHFAAVAQGVGYGQLVDILQFVAEAYASGYGGDLHRGILPQTVHYVEECGLALHGCRDGEDHLPYAAFGHAVDEFVYLQVRGPDTLHGRYDSPENIIQTAVLACVLDRHEVSHLLDNAYRGAVTLRIFAYRAYIRVGEVVAKCAVAYVVAEAGDALGHAVHGLGIHLEQVHRQAQGRAAAYARELGKLRYRLLQKF